MSGIVRIAVPVAKTGVALLVKHWPAITAAFGLLVKFLANNPNIPAWFKGRVEDFQKAVSTAVKQPDKAGQIRDMVAAVRTQSTGLAGYLDAEQWTRRADVIESQLAVVESQPPRTRKKALARLRSRTDEFVAEFSEALTAIDTSRSRNADLPSDPGGGRSGGR